MKNQMSIYSIDKGGRVYTDLFGNGYYGYYKPNYVLLTEKEHDKFLRKENSEKEKWNRIAKDGYISAADISKLTLWSAENVKRWMEEAGYYWFINKNIYKNGARFWKLEDAKRVFWELGQKLDDMLESLEPAKEYFNGEVVSIWYGYSGKRLYVEEVRQRQEQWKKDELKRKREEMLRDEESVMDLMDEIFEQRKHSGGAGITDILDNKLNGREVIYYNGNEIQEKEVVGSEPD